MMRAGASTVTSRSAPGFTLVETLVALAVLALLVGIAVSMRPGRSHAEAIGAAREIASLLRETRIRAGMAAQSIAVRADPQRNRIWSDSGRSLALPSGIRMSLAAAAHDPEAPGAGLFLFRPDGSGSGGIIAIDPARGGGRVVISVDWLTGRVEIARAQSERAR